MEPGMPLYSLESVACLLRSYNHLLAPAAPAPAPDYHARVSRFEAYSSQRGPPPGPPPARVVGCSKEMPRPRNIKGNRRNMDVHNVVNPLLAGLPPQLHCLPPYCHHLPPRNTTLLPSPTSDLDIRRRGEKRPIPPELKDEKYFERRRRNNQAAKKSRDARRIREDQIAWRACLLEQENASLRAHVAALRQEALALRSLLAARDEPAAPAPSSTTPD